MNITNDTVMIVSKDILNYIGSYLDNGTLISLARVNKKWYRFLLDLIKERFHFKYKGWDWNIWLGLKISNFTKLDNYIIQRITRKPILQAYVNNITLKEYTPGNIYEFRNYISLILLKYISLNDLMKYRLNISILDYQGMGIFTFSPKSYSPIDEITFDVTIFPGIVIYLVFDNMIGNKKK